MLKRFEQFEEIFEEDPNLVEKFYGRRNCNNIEHGYYENFPHKELFPFVLKYLNYKMPRVYHEGTEDPFVRTIRENLWRDGGGYQIVESTRDKEICYIFYFDSDYYRFEAWVFVTQDRRIFFTDWAESEARTQEIANL
jgi:hypothetical protein